MKGVDCKGPEASFTSWSFPLTDQNFLSISRLKGFSKLVAKSMVMEAVITTQSPASGGYPSGHLQEPGR